MAYENKAGFQTCEHIPPANTQTNYTSISFDDTVAQSTANMRTCFHKHELLQNCCTRTFRTYEHASNMPSKMRTYVDTNNVHEQSSNNNVHEQTNIVHVSPNDSALKGATGI